MKKSLITILIILIAAAGYITYKRGWWERQTKEVKTAEEIQQEDQIKVESKREDIMLAAAEQMNALSPHETIGQWFPVSFWFDRNDAQNQYVYIDYEDGHYMYRMLAEVLEVDNSVEFSIIGKFEKGDEEWELMEGKDYLYGKVFDIYNWNPDANQPEKVN